MATTKKRSALTQEEKLYKAIQGLFVLQARQIDMSNKDMRKILGVDIDAITKIVNKTLKKNGANTEKGNS